MPGVLSKRGNLDTAISLEGRQGQWEKTKNRAMYSHEERPGRDPSLAALRGTKPANTWILDFWPPEL